MLNAFAKLAVKYEELKSEVQMVCHMCSEHWDPDHRCQFWGIPRDPGAKNGNFGTRGAFFNFRGMGFGTRT